MPAQALTDGWMTAMARKKKKKKKKEEKKTFLTSQAAQGADRTETAQEEVVFFIQGLCSKLF
jgi:hypothetical protein